MMKRKYIFNWEIERISDIKQYSFFDEREFVSYHIWLKNGIHYFTDSYSKQGLYITFLVQPENIIDDIETVIIN